jgi:hypothetical protein
MTDFRQLLVDGKQKCVVAKKFQAEKNFLNSPNSFHAHKIFPRRDGMIVFCRVFVYGLT